VDELPDAAPPAWCGLCPEAEGAMQTRAGYDALENLSLLQGASHIKLVESSLPTALNDTSPVTETALTLVSHWLQLLQPLNSDLQWIFSVAAEAQTDSVMRCMWREKRDGANIIARVLADLLAMKEAKSRSLLMSLKAGLLPTSWRHLWKKRCGSSLPAQLWLQQLCTAGRSWAQPMKQLPLWLPAVQHPEALLTSSRQRCAQSLGWDIELLELQLVLDNKRSNDRLEGDGEGEGEGEEEGTGGFVDDSQLEVSGLCLEGAAVREARVVLTTQQRQRLSPTRFQWRQCLRPSNGGERVIHSEKMQVAVDEEKHWLPVPLYTDSSRVNIVCEVLVELEHCVDREVFILRSVCLVIDGV